MTERTWKLPEKSIEKGMPLAKRKILVDGGCGVKTASGELAVRDEMEAQGVRHLTNTK